MRFALASAGGLLAACQPQAVKDAAPPIRTLGNQSQPAPSKLPIIRSEPVAPDPQKALDNYQKLIDLNPDPETRAEAMRRMADLGVEVEDNTGNSDSSGQLQKSIGIYQQLLRDRPDDPGNDRLLYQMARAYQNSGDTPHAIETLARLKRDYPSSPLIADARYHNAELLYQRNRFAEAEEEYHGVMAYGTGSPFFEPAQYKYGWSLFKQQRYEDDLAVFFDILKRELPPGELEDPKTTLAAVPPAKADLTKDSLHVVSLSFGALGGGPAISRYFKQHGEPAFYPLVYNAEGDFLLEKQRYSDAANSYAAFVDAHPGSPRAPAFQARVIAAYKEGGFNDLVVREKERYVGLYEPSAPYWSGRAPTQEVMDALRQDFEDLGRHYQARAQQAPKDSPAARADFVAAAGWYRKILEIYPGDPKLPEVNLLYADALYDGGQTRAAAEQYLKTAYGYGAHPKAQEAAVAAVQAEQRLSREVTPAERPAVLRDSVAASIKLADTFPNAPQTAPVLTRAAEDLLEIKDLDQAIVVANRVLRITPPPSDDLRAQALGVVADARFAQGRYADSEAAYAALLQVTPAGSTQRKPVVEQLAASIYKQGEAARAAGDLRTAAGHFLRVGQVTPDAIIRPNADYDAATSYVALQDWPNAEQTLEGFRARFPNHPLTADVDKQLAGAYQKDNKPAQAAAVYQRIAARPGESQETRRESAWLAASLYDQAKQPLQAAAAYETYVRSYPQPIERAMVGRRRMADIALASGDRARYQFWLRDIVSADDAGGTTRTEATRLQAAQANLELGRVAAEDARALRITLPLAKSLPARKNATANAVQYFNRAASYSFVEQTTAATYELGRVYQDFARALHDSDRPGNLKPEEREQYDLLLEEQVTPFEDQAIQAHEGNLERLKQGIWNDSVRRSVDALGELSPAKYGKREKREDAYESLR